jgi:large subunit ribosomal protein L13
MDKLQRTFSATPSDIKREWWVVDASGKTLGRLATQIAHVLRGKHKPYFTTHIDTGDFVVVINVDKITVTGNRMETKEYHRHSGYPSGLRTSTMREVVARFPDRPLRLAVKGMLPKNALGHQMIKKLKVYAGDKHPHEAQQPGNFDDLFKSTNK